MPAHGTDPTQEYEMTRGIHLKQLTRADLDLLGLAEGSLPAAPDQASSSSVPTPDARPETARRQIGPPSNPVITAGNPKTSAPDADWPPFDLGAVARDLCRELEITLRLLDCAGDGTNLPG
jgi:hypothetical protein